MADMLRAGRRAGVLLLALLLGLALAACGSGDGDGGGDTVSASPAEDASPTGDASPAGDAGAEDVAEPAADVDTSRIVPLNGDIAEVVWALGLGDNVAATDVSATYPPEAQELPKIGYQRDLAAEGILSVAPTLVVGTPDAGPPEVIDQIRDAGVPVEIVEYPATLEGPAIKIRAVAEVLGVTEEGERLAARTTEEIEAARARVADVADRPRVLFLYARGPNVLQVGGRDSGADAMITAAGGIDAGTEAGIDGFTQLTPEAVTTAAPDVLLLLSAGLESLGGVEGLLAVPGIQQTPAGQQRRVVDLDDQYLLGLGPRAGQALDDLIDQLHPDLPGSSANGG